MPAVVWFDLSAFDAPPDLNHEVDYDDWRLVGRRQRMRSRLAAEAARQARQAGAAVVGLPLGVAAMQFTAPEALRNVRAFSQAAHAQGLKLRVRVGAYDVSTVHAHGLPRPAEPFIPRADLLAAGADEVEPFTPARSVPSDAADPLRQKADRVNAALRRQHLLDGQVITVLDTREDLLGPGNEWQEDSDWLTGLYCGAMSMAYRATGDEQYAAFAREAFGALHELSTVAGVPGVVARHSRRQKPTDLGSGRKRWRQAPDGVRWWSGDTGRDQLSGHFLGLAVYHDLMADEGERRLIREDIDTIVGQIVAHHMWAFDADEQPCTHANFFVAHLQALATLQVAWHVTGKAMYRGVIMELIDPHFFLGHAVKECARQQDPFFQHYQQDSPIYSLLMYEQDQRLLRAYLRGLRLLYESTKANGNAYHLVQMAIFQPETPCGAMAVHELSQFRDDHLETARWRADTEELLAQPDGEPNESVRAVLRGLLSGSTEGLDPDFLMVPCKWRPPMEFGWQYHVNALPDTHGPFVRYSGVDYLIAFWMGRYHGVL